MSIPQSKWECPALNFNPGPGARVVSTRSFLDEIKRLRIEDNPRSRIKSGHCQTNSVLRKRRRTVIPWRGSNPCDEKFETLVLRGSPVAGRLSVFRKHGGPGFMGTRRFRPAHAAKPLHSEGGHLFLDRQRPALDQSRVGGGNHSGVVLHGLGRLGNFTPENGRWAGGLCRVPASRRAKPVVAGPICGVGICRPGRGGNFLWLCRPSTDFYGPFHVPGTAAAAPNSFRKAALGAGPAGFVPGLGQYPRRRPGGIWVAGSGGGNHHHPTGLEQNSESAGPDFFPRIRRSGH